MTITMKFAIVMFRAAVRTKQLRALEHKPMTHMRLQNPSDDYYQ